MARALHIAQEEIVRGPLSARAVCLVSSKIMRPLAVTLFYLAFLCIYSAQAGYAQVTWIGHTHTKETTELHMLQVGRSSLRMKSLYSVSNGATTGYVVGKFQSPRRDTVLEVSRPTPRELLVAWSLKNGTRRSATIALSRPLGTRFTILAGFDRKGDGFEDIAIVDQTGPRLRWFLIENPAGSSPREAATFLHGRAGDKVTLRHSGTGRRSKIFCMAVRANPKKRKLWVHTFSVSSRKRHSFQVPWSSRVVVEQVMRVQRGRRSYIALFSPTRRQVVLVRRGTRRVVPLPRKRCGGTQMVLGIRQNGALSVLEICPSRQFFVTRSKNGEPVSDASMPSFQGTLAVPIIGVRPSDSDEVASTEQSIPAATPRPTEAPTETATPTPTLTETPTVTPTPTPTITPHSWNLATVLGQQYILLDGTLYEWDGLVKGPEVNQGSLLPQLSSLQFSGGSGTAEDPYLISFCLQLQAMSNSLSSHFALAHDIDCSNSTTWNDNMGFTPIGSSAAGAQFTGSLDGRGYTIRGLTSNRPSSSNVALFGHTSHATIQNLTLEDVMMTGYDNVAGLVGYKAFGTVSGCRTTGSVSGILVVGGLAGYNAGGTIEFSSSSASVSQTTGDGWAGGLVAINFAWDNPVTVLRDSFATGSVTGTSTVGGLVGGILFGNSLITRCYATGTVTGGSNVGGFVGSIQSWALVSHSYATGATSGQTNIGGFMGLSWFGMANYNYSLGTVTGTTNVGGFAGRNGRHGSYTANYWNTETSSRATSPIGSGLTSSQMQSAASFNSWDFDTTWTMTPGVLNGFPTLRSIPPQS